MLRPDLLALLLAALLAPAAGAAPVCLPERLVPNVADPADFGVRTFDFGFVAGAPTLCVHKDAQRGQPLHCWAVDPGTGALSASAATSLPGHSRIRRTDASGCIEGYCTAPRAGADESLLFVTSTDEAHAAILRERALHVLDARTKQQVKVIPLSDDGAPDSTNVGNEPIEILYVGRALYVVGADAGPFIGVWSYKDDGTRTGVITRPGDAENAYSVHVGGVNIIDDHHVALANAGLQTMLVLNAADGTREALVRRAAAAPCTKDEMEKLDLGDLDNGGLSGKCRKFIGKNYEPYFDLAPLRLPSGDFLAALSGKAAGALALLDGKTLTEKRRLKLPRCAK